MLPVNPYLPPVAPVGISCKMPSSFNRSNSFRLADGWAGCATWPTWCWRMV